MTSRVTSYHWQGKGDDAMEAVSDVVQGIFLKKELNTPYFDFEVRVRDAPMLIWLGLTLCVCVINTHIYRAYFVTMLGTLESMLMLLNSMSDINRYA